MEQRGPLCRTHTPRRRDTQTRLLAATRTERPGSARAPRRTHAPASAALGADSRVARPPAPSAPAPSSPDQPRGHQVGPLLACPFAPHSPSARPFSSGPLGPLLQPRGLQEPRALPNPKLARANVGHRVGAHPLQPPRAAYASLCPIQVSDRGLEHIIVDHSVSIGLAVSAFSGVRKRHSGARMTLQPGIPQRSIPLSPGRTKAPTWIWKEMLEGLLGTGFYSLQGV